MSIDYLKNSFENNGLNDLIQRAGPSVTQAIHAASNKTGVDFSYMMEQAAAESSFQTDVKAKTSSATGLYQFIESTWMNMMQKHGEKHGLGDFSKHIEENGKVRDPAIKQEILALRKNPEIASVMAAELASDNKAQLLNKSSLSEQEIGATELYFAHFLGASGASSFLDAHKENPLQRAADIFPKAAKANKNVFYDMDTGKSRSLAQVYEFFDKKFGAQPSNDTKSISPAYAATDPSSMDNAMEQAHKAFFQTDFTMMQSRPSKGVANILGLSQNLKNPVELMLLAQFDSSLSLLEDESNRNKRP